MCVCVFMDCDEENINKRLACGHGRSSGYHIRSDVEIVRIVLEDDDTEGEANDETDGDSVRGENTVSFKSL